MATIPKIQSEIVKDFSFLDSWEEKYQYLIELGNKMPPLPDIYRIDENKVSGCQSIVWLHKECIDGRVILQMDSNTEIVKGLTAILVQVLSGQHAEEVIKADLSFFETIGFSKHLSPQRGNGLMAMIEQIKAFAVLCASGEA